MDNGGTKRVSTTSTVRTPVAVGVGFVGGAFGALLGGGTGTITIPVLDKLTDLKRATIHGTATIANIAVAVVGATVYGLRGGAIDPTIGLALMAGGVFGALFGAKFVARAPELVLRLVFTVVLVLSGTKMLLDGIGLDPLDHSPILPAHVRENLVVLIALATALGVVVGAWSSAMGLGGGLLTVPIMVLLFGADLHLAVGTSLVVMLPNSITGAVAHVRQKTASVPLGARLAVGAAVGSVLGALLALVLDSHVLGMIFGVFVLVMAGREIRRMRTRPAQ